MQGLWDTRDKNGKKEYESQGIRQIQTYFNGRECHAMLVCLKCGDKVDHIVTQIIKIAKALTFNTNNMFLAITQVNKEDDAEEILADYDTKCTQWGLMKMFAFTNKFESCYGLWETIKEINPMSIKNYEQITSSDRIIIDEAVSSVWGLCFPSFSSIIVGIDVKSMDKLNHLDQTITHNPITNKSQNCKILTFLHKEKCKTFFEFSCIITKTGSLSISKNHLVYCKRKNSENDYILAGNVQIGDYLYQIKENKTSWCEVINIKIVYDKELYAPLTESGTLIVDSFLTSCYASYKSHNIAHFAMQPLIRKLLLSEDAEVDGIHPYCSNLINIKSMLSY